MTTIVSRTVSSNENYNGDGDFALVTITPEDAKRFLKMIDAHVRLKEEMGGLFRLVFWDGSPDYVSRDWESEWQEEIFDGPMELEDEDGRVHELKSDTISTECITINVCDDRVYWRAYVKHTSVCLETDCVYKTKLEEIAGCS